MNIGLEEKRAISEAYGKVVRCDEKFKGDLIGISKHVRTFAILTAENPFAQRLSRSANRERNDSLERSLKEMNFVFRKVNGFYGTEDGDGNSERSYCVYNISLSSAKYLAAKFNQQSFVFGEASDGDFGDGYRGNRMAYSFYAYRQRKYDEAFERFRKDNEGVEEEIFRRYPKFDGANYVKVDEKRTFDTNREDVYSRKNDFRFTIPFDFFSDEDAIAVGREIDECAKRVGEDRFRRLLSDSVDDSLDGKRQYRSRVMMYGRKDR